MNRRQCLKLLGLGGLGILFTGFTLKPAVAQIEKSKLKCFSKTLPLMDTYVEITVWDKSYNKACEATERAFSKMKKLISIFNRFDPNSYVSWLNTYGRLNDLPSDLYNLLKISRYVHEITSYKFDITVLPILELTSYYLENQNSVPDKNLIEEVLECVGFKYVNFNKKKVSFLRKGVMVTFDGIAKGYIIDKAIEELKRFGISYGLINAGGDIRAIGSDRDKPWIIGIQNPENPDKIIQKIALVDLAIATSGNYENFFDPKKIHYHIIDEKTGFSPLMVTSCSVIAKSAALADGLATGLFVNAPKNAIRLVANLKGVEAEIITNGNRIFRSTGWRNFLIS